MTESDLIAKYSEYCGPRQKVVIHVENLKTCRMEKYIYNYLTMGFEEVDYPEVVYDSTRDSEAGTLFVLTGNLTTVISKTPEGRLVKEQYCSVKKGYVRIPEHYLKPFSPSEASEIQNLEFQKRQEKLEEIRAKIRMFHPEFFEGPNPKILEDGYHGVLESKDTTFEDVNNDSEVEMESDSEDEDFNAPQGNLLIEWLHVPAVFKDSEDVTASDEFQDLTKLIQRLNCEDQ